MPVWKGMVKQLRATQKNLELSRVSEDPIPRISLGPNQLWVVSVTNNSDINGNNKVALLP